MTLDEILEQSPEIEVYGGGQWAMYSIGCCWWTSFPEDLGVLTGLGHLPCCPHCQSVLMQGPLDKFIQSARGNPEHYGRYGLEAFTLSHSRNYDHCWRDWESYNLVLWARKEIENAGE